MPGVLSKLPAHHRLLHLGEIESTNREAMRLALAGDGGPLWVLADRQTAGRGRSGRVWSSEPGNLFASLLVTLASPSAKAYQLSLVTGVAVIDAIGEFGCLRPGAALRLKWPNDILIGGAKTGGILVETTSTGGDLKSVIGIGLNLGSHPEGIEPAATHLGAHGRTPEAAAILAPIAASLEAWLATWQEGAGFAAVRAAWLERAGPPGERCTVKTGEALITGSFIGMDGNGALILLDSDGRERRYDFGDVTLSP